MSSSKRQRYWGRITGKDENNSSDRIDTPAPDQAPSQPGIPSTSPSSSTISLRSRDSRRLSTSSNLLDVPTAPLEPRTIHSATKPNEDRERALPDLWAKAADVLKSDPDPEKRSLIEQYSATLKEEIGPSKMDDCATPFLGLQPGQAAKLLNAKAEELKNRKMTVGSGKHAVEVEPHFNNVAKHIITAKDLINSAARADPHASVACAGVIVILTFLIRQIEQREQLFKGLDLVSSIICRYLVMETVFRPRIQVDSVSKATARDLERDFENNLVNLYAKILEFQARALSYVQRSRPSQFFRDTFRGDTWKTLMADIKDLDGQCRAFADLVTDEKLHSFLDNQLQPSTHSEPKAYAEIVESEQLQRQRAECLRLLDICPYRDRKDINPERAVGTCEWFIDHDLFRAWMNSTRPSILWVSADPGCGKSVLAKFLVDEVLPNKIRDSALCYFFFKEDFADQRTVPVALCSILRQLFLNRPSLLTPKRMTQFINEGKRSTESTSSLFEMLFALAGENDVHICCLIDALDECEESDRRKLISALDKFYMNPDDRQRLKVIVTSRPEMMIQRQFRRLEKSWPKIHLRWEDDEQLAKISQEIDVFARSRTQCITESIPLEPLETQFLQQEISKTKNRTYLWVKMVLDVIENVLAFTTDKAAEILAGLPKGLDMLYEKILNRCQDIEKARNVLQIVIAAVRPLTLEEMAVALAMSTNEHLSSRIKLEPPGRFRETLRAICGLFVTIIDDKIYFIHQTAKEFLARDLADSNVPRLIRTPNESVGPFSWKHTFARAESSIVLAKACMRYLGSRMGSLAMQGLPLSKVEPDPHHVFFEYSALFWPTHVLNSGDVVEDEIKVLATALCEACCSETSDSWFSKRLLMKGYRQMPPDAPAMSSPSLDVYYMEENWIVPLKNLHRSLLQSFVALS
ncbi:Vegetative incompatibility protein HET-E-1 [Colletotrichum fructicola Nara gc5]|uniref:Ankyrin repeat protein n=1 Tax=Colletotrichum fructicola (strain Nara gc5) TaxID=1213859 RepID=L2GGR6_COLFN|nr:Vegetative incompatibility protein HET-E-1 [Colletotrichum fructicola Nara gc5]KAF4883143.1 Vegetative incompatibility protein HET-E-1 [Colletotrichum fructicola]